jgi:hypothetical protein
VRPSGPLLLAGPAPKVMLPRVAAAGTAKPGCGAAGTAADAAAADEEINASTAIATLTARMMQANPFNRKWKETAGEHHPTSRMGRAESLPAPSAVVRRDLTRCAVSRGQSATVKTIVPLYRPDAVDVGALMLKVPSNVAVPSPPPPVAKV